MRRDTTDNTVEITKINQLVERFYQDATKHHYKGYMFPVPIMFDNKKTESSVLGTCYYGFFRYITVNKKNWKELNYLQKKMVIYHELGHCVLDRDHEEDNIFPLVEVEKFTDQCPKSIMVRYIPKVSCLVTHQKEYINDLFIGK